MLKAKMMVLMLVALTSLVAAAYAACGDSQCAWGEDGFICIAEGPGGEGTVCTEAHPCTINCPS
ncbi:hypothetical protein [Shewanella sp. NIFS-20-20]|uniref:hypothetical protein n=1 Tax=Shewanella sp. NIFS-20-20 TaxID=2853806 RepID=UPI001C461323|nr:hypothetical protein [Shewanella sp. NIFS-20-20]MBV7316015.1 hypothetical protein [Shewanella sp. NIFS-20-20]